MDVAGVSNVGNSPAQFWINLDGVVTQDRSIQDLSHPIVNDRRVASSYRVPDEHYLAGYQACDIRVGSTPAVMQRTSSGFRHIRQKYSTSGQEIPS